MKKLYSLIILLLILTPGFSQIREWNGGNGNWDDASKWSPVGIPEPSDIVVFNNSSATISNVPGLSFKGIVVNDANIILNASSQQVKVLTAGYNNQSSGIEVNTGASLTIGNNLFLELADNARAAIDGVLIINTNSRYYSDKGTSTRTTVKGTIRNSGQVLSGSSMLEFLDGAKYEHSRDKGEIPAAAWHKNSTCVITGVISTAPGGLDQVFGNYKWDCENQTGGAQLGIAIPAGINSDLVINKVGRENDPSVFLQLPGQIKIGGALILNSGQCKSNGTIANIDLEGDFIIRGGSITKGMSQGNNTIRINFSGIQKQVYSKTGGLIDGIQFSIRDKACLDLGDMVVDGEIDFIVEAGARLMTEHPEGIAIAGNSGAIQVKGKRIFSSEADYAYTGTGTQVTGTGLPAVVRRLIIDNKNGSSTSAGVNLSNEILVRNELVLLNGFLQTTADQILTIGNDGTVSGTEESFVAGPMRKTGSSSFIFPTGWAGPGGGRIPIGIGHTGSAATIQAEYKRAPATDKGATINAPLHHINYCEYWELFPVTGTPKAIVTMFHNAHSSCSPVSLINDFSTTRVARSNGIAWSQVGNAGDSLNGGNGYVISGNEGISLSKEERFYALGNITNATDPLPVMFDNVQAYEKNTGVNIEWSNLTERDIAIYYVERSSNGLDYTIIGQYLPTSNRDDKARYTSFDANPNPGTNFYRIKVIEKSTKIIFSKVMRVETGLPGRNIRLYPNPVANKQIILGLSGMTEGKYGVSIINAVGQPVSQTNIENKGNFMTQIVQLPLSIHPGVYSMVITGVSYRETKMFIVQ